MYREARTFCPHVVGLLSLFCSITLGNDGRHETKPTKPKLLYPAQRRHSTGSIVSKKKLNILSSSRPINQMAGPNLVHLGTVCFGTRVGLEAARCCAVEIPKRRTRRTFDVGKQQRAARPPVLWARCCSTEIEFKRSSHHVQNLSVCLIWQINIH